AAYRKRHGVLDDNAVGLRRGSHGQLRHVLVVNSCPTAALDEIPVYHELMARNRSAVVNREIALRTRETGDVDRAVDAVEVGRRGADGDEVGPGPGALHIKVQAAGGAVDGDVVGSGTGVDRRQGGAKAVAVQVEPRQRIVDSEDVAEGAGADHQRLQ